MQPRTRSTRRSVRPGWPRPGRITAVRSRKMPASVQSLPHQGLLRQASGCSKTVRSSVATHGWVGFGTCESRPRADQRAQERQPAGAVLDGGDIQATDLAVPADVDADRDQRGC